MKKINIKHQINKLRKVTKVISEKSKFNVALNEIVIEYADELKSLSKR